MRIRTVLCPVDFSGLDPIEIGVASEVCRAFDATLLLHHDVAAAQPGFSRTWEWSKAHEGHQAGVPEAERRLAAVMGKLRSELRVEAIVTSGPVAQVILSLAEQLGVDLVVLGSHGWSTPDHASVTERLVRESPCPVLTFQDGIPNIGPFRLHTTRGEDPIPVLVPTDLTRGSSASVAYACALARQLPIRLDLLHVATGDPDDAAVERAEVAIDAHVPPDLADRATAHVRIGPAVETIVQYADETLPGFVVLGEHAHSLVRRLLTRDTTRAVMRELRCPVWVVPPGIRV